ncbi:MAG: DUF6132 family protein [bacterium]
MKKISRKGRKKMIAAIIGAAVGALIGYLMYINIGCQTGTCPLMSKSWLSIVYFAIIGALVSSSIF